MQKSQITADGRTVWVNSFDGSLGRFSRFGVDVHTLITAQMNGAPQCLACTHERPNLADWRRFQTLMRQYYNVRVGDRHMPDFIRAEML